MRRFLWILLMTTTSVFFWGGEVLGQLGGLAEVATMETLVESGTVAVAESSTIATVTAGGVAAGGAAAGAGSAAPSEMALELNMVQWVIWIMEALEENKVNDATKEVNVKGEMFLSSQGEPQENPYALEEGMSDTTIASSARGMITLLQTLQIDMELLSTDIAKPEENKVKKAKSITGGKSGSDVYGTTQTTVTAEETDLTTEEEIEIRRRRALLLAEWATGATQVGAGSNAISRTFNARVEGFAVAANSAEGSLGGISAIADTDRFVLFEITRGAALSAIGLGLQGARNLNNLSDIVANEETRPQKTNISITIATPS